LAEELNALKRLILIRHAKSSWSNLKISDFDRPLNKRGKQEAPLMAQRLGHNYAITDLAVMLTSVYISKIPTSGVVAMDLAIGSWAEAGAGKGGMLFFDYPEKHEARK